MHPQDQFELYGDGCRNEHQRAFALSQSEREIDDRISIALAQGKHVVVQCRSEYCLATDSYLGVKQVLWSQHDTDCQAKNASTILNDQYGDDDIYFEVIPTH